MKTSVMKSSMKQITESMALEYLTTQKRNRRHRIAVTYDNDSTYMMRTTIDDVRKIHATQGRDTQLLQEIYGTKWHVDLGFHPTSADPNPAYEYRFTIGYHVNYTINEIGIDIILSNEEYINLLGWRIQNPHRPFQQFIFYNPSLFTKVMSRIDEELSIKAEKESVAYGAYDYFVYDTEIADDRLEAVSNSHHGDYSPVWADEQAMLWINHEHLYTEFRMTEKLDIGTRFCNISIDESDADITALIDTFISECCCRHGMEKMRQYVAKLGIRHDYCETLGLKERSQPHTN